MDRRPRSIQPGTDVPQAPPEPAAPDPANPALWWQQRRFQRALLGGATRRDPFGERALRRARDEPGDRSERQGPPAAGTAPRKTPTACAPPGEGKPTAGRGTRTIAASPVSAPGIPPRPDPCDDPEAWRLEGLPGPAPQGWDRDLAERIVRLCRKAEAACQSFTVTVSLDPCVLPQTELDIRLSPQRLALLFRTQSAYSLALVSRHVHTLVEQLQGALPQVRDVDVETA